MSLVRFALSRPYTVIAMVLLVCLLGVFAGLRMPLDIFPEIDIPVCSVVWTYNGMNADEIQNRILVKHERQMASLVDDIARMDATSYNGVGVIKVYLHDGADVSRAVSQLTSSAQTVLKSMPRNITPPLILRYGATDVPIIQLSISSDSLPDQRLTDFGQQVLRPSLAVVRGASVPYPYGGKPRVVMVDLDMQALHGRGLTPTDVTTALEQQNLVAPSGDVKIGDRDYAVRMNNSTETVEAINDLPVKKLPSGGALLVRDVAHVRDGYSVQTNSVSANGQPGTLMTIRKTGGVSTLGVINGIKKTLEEDIPHILPAGAKVRALFDQSIFVKAAINSVLMGGAMAAGLTALMILLFLGNWRLTTIILISIPLSIVTAVLVLYAMHQTLNTMTLGGFALAVGILVDNATVVIENIERNLGLGMPLEPAIVNGSSEIAKPTVVSTLAICIVFVPVFLLEGVAKYLFSPLSLSVIVSLLASLVLSFTLVPVLFKYLLRNTVPSHGHGKKARNPFMAIHYGFERGFGALRDNYRGCVSWAVRRPVRTACFFGILLVVSCLLFPQLGMDFFPQVDAGQMRLHVRAPVGTKIEQTKLDFALVEKEIRKIVGEGQVDTILDNIGLPYSGINIALSDTATVGPMDGEVLVALKEKHTPTAAHVADLRRELPKRFPGMQFFFQPADIVNQVLNFGQPAPIDIRVSGPKRAINYATATKILHDLKGVPGIADAHIFQVPDAPAMNIDVDRALAQGMGLNQRDVANSVLVTLSSSASMSPNFWLNPTNNVSYPLLVQTPQYLVNSLPDVLTVPVAGTSNAGGRGGAAGRPAKAEQHMLMDVAHVTRGNVPMVLSQVNIRPVFDVHADVQGTDLATVAAGIDRVINADRPDAASAVHVDVAGQVETMRESFAGLAGGMGLAVVLVYLLLAINFQSWVDPVIVLLAVPFALVGVMWMLFGSFTHVSVPALMGTLMCIGLTTANSTLVVSFANQRMAAGDDALTAAIAAGYTRLRPVLMTAGAMVLGMIPMALGAGEGGEQNAPLARAVIGGLVFATVATLVFVPTMYQLMRRGKAPATPATPVMTRRAPAYVMEIPQGA